MLDKHGMDVRLNTRAGAGELADYDEVVLATGVTPRMPEIPGIDNPMVLSYAEAIMGRPIGKAVAVVGTGGIGFDVSEFIGMGAPRVFEGEGCHAAIGRELREVRTRRAPRTTA